MQKLAGQNIIFSCAITYPKMSSRKKSQKANDGLKQTDLRSFFQVSKSATVLKPNLNKTTKKGTRTPKSRIKKKSPKAKQKILESESEDDACDPYSISKSNVQRENLTQDQSQVLLNKPTPLKTKYSKSCSKMLQLKSNIMEFENKRECTILESPKKHKAEIDETRIESPKKVKSNNDNEQHAASRNLFGTEVKTDFDPDKTDVVEVFDLDEYGVYDTENDKTEIDIADSDNEENGISGDGGTFIDFSRIISYVEKRPNLYSVLYEEEHKFLQAYNKLSENSRYFCFRLFTRQLIWYGVADFVSKIELDMAQDSISEMVRVLEENKMIQTDYSKEEPVILLNKLVVADVRSIYKSFKIKGKHKKKNELINAIIKHCSTQTTLSFSKSIDDILLERIAEKIGRCLKLETAFYNMLSRLHLLYSFMNPDFIRAHDLYQFMRAIRLKETRLPVFITDSTPVFTTENFTRYFLAVELFNEYMIAKEKGDEKSMMKISKLAFTDFKEIVVAEFNDEAVVMKCHKSYTAGRVLAKILSMACKQFTKKSELVMEWLQYLMRQDQYALKRRGDWFNHLALIHEKLHDIDAAVDIVIEAFVDPNVPDIIKHELSHRASRLVKKSQDENAIITLNALILQPPDKDPFPFIVINALQNREDDHMRLLFMVNGGNMNVEEVALSHYRQNGFPKGLHCEGRLMVTIYFLFFWFLIFDYYIPGTFITEVQYFPLDFFSQDFYLNRKQLIDKRLKDIESDWSEEDFMNILTQSEDRYKGIFTLAPSDIMNGNIVCDAVKCMGRTVLSKILERLVKNFRDHKAGMPDLFIYNPETKQCKFVEVKSENDVLSMKQKVWLNYLRSIGASIEMCHVISEGSKVKRKLLKKV